MAKLNQILAVEKGRKTALHEEITALHKATQKAQLVTGHHKTYQPLAEDGETYPDDVQHVQYKMDDVIEEVSGRLAVLMDVTAIKDWANCDARSDIMVNGEVFISNVPVTYMLFLEKELNDLHTFVAKMVELDPGEKWTLDPNSGLFRSGEIKTHKTKKMQRPVVLYDATEHHPAQTQLITDDVVVGHWVTTKFSGAIPKPRKKELLERIRLLLDAVKYAREQANSIEVRDQDVGKKILDFVFA